MNRIAFVIIFLVSLNTLFAQQLDTWTAFWNPDTTYIGFKNNLGQTMIEPKFMGLTSARTFSFIMAAMEEKDGEYISYYLTKSGKIIGRDSLFFFDNAADCENEGFIRFMDPITEKVGLFNRHGKVVIPAEYDGLSMVRNGVLAALKGARKEKMGEYFNWKGGAHMLLDTNNNVLANPFNPAYNLNYYSLETEDEESTDSIRLSFKSVNEDYLTFIDFEKEFKLWFQNKLLSDLSLENLLSHGFEEITYSDDSLGWISSPKALFLNYQYDTITAILNSIQSENSDYYFNTNGLNPFIFESEKYDIYFNNCGEAKEWQYPLMGIVINMIDDKHTYQYQISFLRTDEAYQLISFSSLKHDL